MAKFPLIAALILFTSLTYGQAQREVVQSCDFKQTIKSSENGTYLTLCAEDDQHSMELKLTGELDSKDQLVILDGDDLSAKPFELIRKTSGDISEQVFTSTRLCLTVNTKLNPGSFLELTGNCVAIDRSKWPLYQAKRK